MKNGGDQILKIVRFWLISMLAIALLVGCSNNSVGSNNTGNDGGSQNSPTTTTPPGSSTTETDSPKASEPEPSKLDSYQGGPVEIVIHDRNTGITPEEFEEYFAQVIKSKYPDITVTYVKETIDALIAAGTVPDMVAVSNTVLNVFMDLDYPQDLNPAIKEFNFDTNRVEPVIMDALTGLGKTGAIYGLPFGMNHGAMLYNKDLFDKFGVDYPKDRITWDEFLDLSQKLTRQDGGVQYIGGAPNSALNLVRQYGASNFDDKDERAVMTTEGHQQVFTLLQKFFQIPDLIQGNTYLPTNINSGTIAMQTNWITAISTSLLTNNPSFEWDLSTFPAFSHRPEYGNPVDFHMLTVSKTTPHKEAAYRVLFTMLSDEVQMKLTKNRRITPLKDPDIKMMFASDSDIFKGKNLESIFMVSPAPLPDYSIWKSTTDKFITEAISSVALNNIDINTALRQAEEKANQAIQEVRAQTK